MVLIRYFVSRMVEYFEEREYDGYKAGGFLKHWHLYEVAAKKK
jgi:hypothetical protein